MEGGAHRASVSKPGGKEGLYAVMVDREIRWLLDRTPRHCRPGIRVPYLSRPRLPCSTTSRTRRTNSGSWCATPRSPALPGAAVRTGRRRRLRRHPDRRPPPDPPTGSYYHRDGAVPDRPRRPVPDGHRRRFLRSPRGCTGDGVDGRPVPRATRHRRPHRTLTSLQHPCPDAWPEVRSHWVRPTGLAKVGVDAGPVGVQSAVPIRPGSGSPSTSGWRRIRTTGRTARR